MVIPEGYAQANFRFGGVSAPNGAEVTMGFDITVFPGDPAFMAAQLGTNWVESFLLNQASSITLEEVLVKFGPNDIGPFAEVAVGEAGGAEDTGWTPQVAVLVRKVTALGGRRHRGRMFIPGYAENVVSPGGQLESTPLATLQADADSFLAKCVADDLDPVVLHGESLGALAPTPITGLQVAGTVATQRRRLRD